MSIFRLTIATSPVLFPETVISTIALTLLLHSNMGHDHFKDFLGEVHILKGLREQ